MRVLKLVTFLREPKASRGEKIAALGGANIMAGKILKK